jgi:hypothetical protein
MERRFKGLKLEGGGQGKVLKELRKQQWWIERGLKVLRKLKRRWARKGVARVEEVGVEVRGQEKRVQGLRKEQ